MNRYLNNEQGVGLIELLVSILIMAGVVAAILVAYTSQPVQSSQGSALLLLQQEGSLALEEMSGAIREAAAGALNVDEAADVLTADGVIYQVNNGLLVKDAETLLGDYTFEAFGTRVESLSFTDNYDTVNTITIDLVVRVTSLGTGADLNRLQFITQVYPRNRT